MEPLGYSPNIDDSSVSSLVSPIRYNVERSGSTFSLSSLETNEGTHFVMRHQSMTSEGTSGRFGMLAESDNATTSSGNHSSLAVKRQDSSSSVSGTTIYSDAPEYPHERDTLETGAQQQESVSIPATRSTNATPTATADRSSSPGLVSVTPLHSSIRDSIIVGGGNGLSENHHNMTPLVSANVIDGRGGGGSSSSFAQSPSTPRLRRDPQNSRTPLTSISSNLAENANGHTHRITRGYGLPSATAVAANLATGSPIRKTPPKLENYDVENNNEILPNHILSSEGIHLVLGRPRNASDNGSAAPTHASSQADSHGHIGPSRKVKEQPLSYIRRAGMLIYSNGPLYAGTPRLPALPIKKVSVPSNLKEKSSLLIQPEYRDPWGRKRASKLTSLCLLLSCTVFPPLWLLLGTGYFDHLAGTIPRVTKLISLALSIAILAAGTALVIVFSILKD